ncbi:MAG: hypothetical protein R2867_15230 [Caldilineaceae bacterium]
MTQHFDVQPAMGREVEGGARGQDGAAGARRHGRCRDQNSPRRLIRQMVQPPYTARATAQTALGSGYMFERRMAAMLFVLPSLLFLAILCGLPDYRCLLPQPAPLRLADATDLGWGWGATVCSSMMTAL